MLPYDFTPKLNGVDVIRISHKLKLIRAAVVACVKNAYF